MQTADQTVYLALASALGLDSARPETSLRIRRAYANPAPPPPPEDQDIVYYHLLPGPEPSLTESRLLPDGSRSVFRFSPFLLNLVFYGPGAEENAWRVRRRLYAEDRPEDPRRILRRRGIFPVPHPPGPCLVWENWKERHRPRADLVIRLRLRIQETDSAPSGCGVEQPPEILIHR